MKLNKNDCAIIFKEDNTIGLSFPKRKLEDEVKDNEWYALVTGLLLLEEDEKWTKKRDKLFCEYSKHITSKTEESK